MLAHDPDALVSLQIRLEYDLESQDRLVVRPGSDEHAWCIVYKFSGGWRLFFRHDLAPRLQDALREFDPALAFAEPARLDALLGLATPLQRDFFQASIFTHCPAPEEYPLVEMNEDAAFIPYQLAMARTGSRPGDPSQPASIAWSVRQNAQAAELAVETQPAFRRRGYARQVATAWAAAQHRLQRAAFYSHETSNLPSLALRQSLGAIPFADSIGWE